MYSRFVRISISFPENFQNVGEKRSGACLDMSGMHSGDLFTTFLCCNVSIEGGMWMDGGTILIQAFGG